MVVSLTINNHNDKKENIHIMGLRTSKYETYTEKKHKDKVKYL